MPPVWCLLSAWWVSAIGFMVCGPVTTLLVLVPDNTSKQIVLFCALLTIDGFTFVMMISPLAADLTVAVIAMKKDHPGIFGKSGAYAQVFALFTCAIGAEFWLVRHGSALPTVVMGWAFTVYTLGALSASAIAPVMLFTGTKEQNNYLDPVSIKLRYMINFDSNRF